MFLYKCKDCEAVSVNVPMCPMCFSTEVREVPRNDYERRVKELQKKYEEVLAER